MLAFGRTLIYVVEIEIEMLGLIKRNFKYLTIPTFILLYCMYISMVRSHLDYCSSVWTPYRKGDIEALEKVQKRETKILPGLKNLSHSQRLKSCKIPTLHCRRIGGDMIETYKIQCSQWKISTRCCSYVVQIKCPCN